MQQSELDLYHREHTFERPQFQSIIVSPLTSTAYEIGHPLGEGSFGEVFECEDEWENQLVAKVIKSDANPFEEAEVKTFLEVQASSIARSPNVCTHSGYIRISGSQLYNLGKMRLNIARHAESRSV